MSPDWSAKEAPVPYAKLDDPQSLNLYEYVGNNPLSRVDIDGHINCSGTNAGGISCQAIAEWNKIHGVVAAVKNSVYVKTEAGIGVKAQVKTLSVKSEIGFKSVRENNAKFNNKGTIKNITEASAKIKLGSISIGPSISDEQTIQKGNAREDFDAPSEVHGNFLYDLGDKASGSNFDIGVGAGLFVGIGGSIEVGVDSKELLQGIHDAFRK